MDNRVLRSRNKLFSFYIKLLLGLSNCVRTDWLRGGIKMTPCKFYLHYIKCRPK